MTVELSPQQKGWITRRKNGWKHSEETKRKLREAMTGSVISEEQKEKLKLAAEEYWADVERSDKHRVKCSKLGKANKGRILLSMRGPNHYRWVEDRSLISYHNTLEHKVWRICVFERDDYTCQECGARGVYLEPHHIKSVEEYPELVYDTDNGQTLCILHHAEKHPERYALIMSRAA